jgi:hypothetical protein
MEEVVDKAVYCYGLFCHGACCFGCVVTLKRAKAKGRTDFYSSQLELIT